MGISLLESVSFYRWILSGFVFVALKLVMDRVLSVRTAFAQVEHSPGRVALWLDPFHPIAVVLFAIFPRPGMCGHYAGKFSLYKKFGSTSFASISVSSARPFFWLADPEAITIVTSDRHTFQKDLSEYQLIDFYGPSIASVEGSNWKRHRRVAMPAFNEANIALLWTETLRVVNEWFEQLDTAGSDITVDMLSTMQKVTLFVIASTSFGRRTSWVSESTTEKPPGCKLSFRSAIMNVVDNVIFKICCPDWFYELSPLVRVPYLSSHALVTRLAFDDLQAHMLDLVASARAEIMSGGHVGGPKAALLRNLVEANMSQDADSGKLTDGEVLSNIFIFLLAGYGTTAAMLCFAFLLLALYPDYQQKVYEEVTRIWSADTSCAQLTLDHKDYMDKLVYTSAFVRETLRLLPAEPRLSKEVHKDTTLSGTYFVPGSRENPSVETGKFVMTVPMGSTVVIDIWALHMNPLCWGEDAADFKPERFIDTPSYKWPRNAFLPFSAGARSCIGQRFALTEIVCIIASVVRRYQIRVPDDLAKKPLKEQEETLLKWKAGLTLAPTNVNVKLCRRI